MIKTLFQLFLAFAKIGFTSFGGTSMIPLIMEEMLSHNWMTADDVANIVAIAEMTPGSLGVNCATFAGTQTAGVLGGTAAVIGVLTPTLTLTLAAALFFQKFLNFFDIIHNCCHAIFQKCLCFFQRISYRLIKELALLFQKRLQTFFIVFIHISYPPSRL